MFKNKPYTIAVCGGSGSGKTTFVNLLSKNLGEENVLVISQDHYYKDLSHLTPKERDKVNFDDPNSLDQDLLIEQFRKLTKGLPIKRPNYNLKTHCREEKTLELNSRKILIFDGIFSLSFPELRKIYDLTIYMDVPDDLRFIRRLKRDMEQRGRTMLSVVDQYLKTVKPMHHKFIGPCKKHADFVIPWIEKNHKIIKALSLQTIFLK